MDLVSFAALNSPCNAPSVTAILATGDDVPYNSTYMVQLAKMEEARC
jgi:hypothetical protein